MNAYTRYAKPLFMFIVVGSVLFALFAAQSVHAATDAYKQRRQEFSAAKERYAKTKTPVLRAALEAATRAYLAASITMMATEVDGVTGRVRTLRDVAEADRAALLGELEPHAAWLSATATSLESARPATFSALGKELRTRWSTLQPLTKRVLGELQAARTRTLIEKLDTLVAKTREKIEEFREAGYHTAQLETLLTTATEQLTSAQEQLTSAQTTFATITKAATMRALYKEGSQKLRKAHAAVQEGHTTVRQLVTTMKALAANPPAKK